MCHIKVQILRESKRLSQNIYAGIAQLVEQLIRNEQAAGSSPITSSTKKHPLGVFLVENIDRLFIE